ncbi:MAG: hypothetical protein LKG26_00265 [Saccharofermentans sp.]|jgi:CarD family transcriptional regulator|nr:hypothetical protein [Mageeibacillus sp.]MCI1263544.1 hypothetical protein [Saccharofermentans sp.]MCI1274517.1 hypothetical protein [Saccharofermentans sp.]
MEFKIGDNIVYGGNGVCQIDDIKDISFFHEQPQKYYVLKPLFVKQAAVVYVPFENKAQVSRIQPVLSKKEAIALIDALPIKTGAWIEDRNERKEMFSDIVANGACEEILGLINLINTKASELSKDGKHLNAQDERVLADAKNRINNEFAVALEIEPDGVYEMIHEKTGIEDFA